MHKENRVLSKVKPLLTKLHGDHTWIPCGMLVGSSDQELFTETERFVGSTLNGSSKPSAAPSIINGDSQPGSLPSQDSTSKQEAGLAAADVRMRDPERESPKVADEDDSADRDRHDEEGPRRSNNRQGERRQC